jgi:hypothetical protein
MQSVLDAWAGSSEGALITPCLTEILGKRSNFLKGPAHFEYAANYNHGAPIYHVADAVSEISTAREYSVQYNIVPVGFGYVIEKQQVMDAVKLIQAALSAWAGNKMPHPEFDGDININHELLFLPDRQQVEESLRSAGARFVASGGASEIMINLRKYFETARLLVNKHV